MNTSNNTTKAAVELALRELRDAIRARSEPFNPDRLDMRDPALIDGVMPLVRAYRGSYLKARFDGLEHIERLGRAPALFVSNHNGGIVGPDLFSTLGLFWETLGPQAPVYALAHDFAMRHACWLGRFIQRFGAVRAAPGNAERILESGGQALVYPGGDIDAYRHYKRRNEIIFGERTGFIKIARRAGVPIIPIVVHGAHRSAYIFYEGEGLARRIGMPRWARLSRFPIALALPWGIAAGPWLPYLPLPFPLWTRVLPPVHVGKEEAPEAARDRTRGLMQAALDQMAREAGDAV